MKPFHPVIRPFHPVMGPFYPRAPTRSGDSGWFAPALVSLVGSSTFQHIVLALLACKHGVIVAVSCKHLWTKNAAQDAPKQAISNENAKLFWGPRPHPIVERGTPPPHTLPTPHLDALASLSFWPTQFHPPSGAYGHRAIVRRTHISSAVY